ncbi:phage tail protein [Enterobacter cloacae]|uniref:phage tail protein n=1 Tax=Enterobacter cloacae TaxID=550 RepID=UPI0039C61B4C
MALQLLAANNAQSVLAAGISASATSLTLNTGTGDLFPSPVPGTSFFKLTLVDAATGSLTEIVHVTARAGDVFTIQRGQEGTVPRAWSANDIVANMMTAGTLSYILGNFQPLDPTLTALAALVGVANKLPYFNGNDTAALTDLTQVGRDIVGKSTIADILTYLRLGAGAPAIGIPFFWPSAAMPNTVMTEWADMVFLKFNGLTFSASTYPKLALVIPSLTLTEARGEFIRVWDDGRGIDTGRSLLSAQTDAQQRVTGSSGGKFLQISGGVDSSGAITATPVSGQSSATSGTTSGTFTIDFDNSKVARTATENRPRNIAFNLLVRAK